MHERGLANGPWFSGKLYHGSFVLPCAFRLSSLSSPALGCAEICLLVPVAKGLRSVRVEVLPRHVVQ